MSAPVPLEVRTDPERTSGDWACGVPPNAGVSSQSASSSSSTSFASRFPGRGEPPKLVEVAELCCGLDELVGRVLAACSRKLAQLLEVASLPRELDQLVDGVAVTSRGPLAQGVELERPWRSDPIVVPFESIDVVEPGSSPAPRGGQTGASSAARVGGAYVRRAVAACLTISVCSAWSKIWWLSSRTIAPVEPAAADRAATETPSGN